MTARAHLPALGARRISWGSSAVHTRAFAVLVAAYLLVILGRIHEVIFVLQPFRLGMVTSVVMAIAAVKALRGELLNKLVSSGAGRSFAVVVAMVFLTVPTGVWPGASVAYIMNVYYQMAILFVVVTILFLDQKASRVVILALVAEVSVAGLLPMILGTQGRFAIGYTYDQNETAALFALMIPWAIFVIATEKGWRRLVGLIAVPLYIYGIIKTGSRGGLLAIAAMVPFLIYLAPPKRRAIFGLAIVMGAVATSLSLDARTLERFKKAFDSEEYNYTTEDGRINIWKRGLGYIASNPIQGVGINGFQYKELETKTNKGFGIRQAAAHNMYIQVAAELGLVGFGGLMAMVWFGWRGCSKVRKRLKGLLNSNAGKDIHTEILRANMAQAALLSVLFTGFFLSLGYSAILYFALAAAVGVGLGGGRYVAAGPPGGPPAPPTSRRRSMRGWRSVRSAASLRNPS